MSARPKKEQPYLLLEEAAELARASVPTIRFWIAKGKLAAFKPGRRVLIKRADLLALIDGAPMPGAGLGE